MAIKIEGERITIVRSLSVLAGVEEDIGRITELQFAYDAPLDPEELAWLANKVFGSNLLPLEVHTKEGGFDDRDHLFAERGFGVPYTIIPHFARLRRKIGSSSDEQTIEAWMSPVLVPNDHFLAKKSEEMAVILFKDSVAVNIHQPRHTIAPLDFFAGNVPVQYLRLTLSPSFYSQAKVSEAFGIQKVNIYEVWQPEAEAREDKEIAFILEPCLSVRFKQAMGKIRSLQEFRAVNALLPVIGARLRTPREAREL